MPKNKSLTKLCEEWPSRLRGRTPDGRAITESSRAIKNPLAVETLTAQMAATKITGQAARSSSGKRPPASILIGEVVLQETEIEDFGKSVAFARDVLDTENMAGLDDLEEARKSLDNVSNKKQALSKFMRENPRFDSYQVVSFSALTAKHLEDMGINSKILREDHRDRILRLFDTFELEVGPMKPRKRRPVVIPSAIFEPFWLELTKDGRYVNDFKLLKNNIGKKPEARARMLTDYILTQLIAFVHMRLNLVQLMFLELILSSSSNPIPVEHRNTATLLTGSVDYAIMSSADARVDLATSLGVGLDDVEERVRELNREGNLDDLMRSKIWPTLLDAKHFKFTIIEEKRKDLGAKKLKDCQPQVTGEALALQTKTQLENVLWCLSNGEDWIFGILNDNKKSRSLPPMSIHDNDIEGSIKTILKMLILWTICPVVNFRHLLDM